MTRSEIFAAVALVVLAMNAILCVVLIAAAIRRNRADAASRKRRSVVLAAIGAGAETSNAVSAITGLPWAACVMTMHELADAGLIRTEYYVYDGHSGMRALPLPTQAQQHQGF